MYLLVLATSGCAVNEQQAIKKKPLLSYCANPKAANTVIKDGASIQLDYDERLATSCQ